jgi:hypothetical protein
MQHKDTIRSGVVVLAAVFIVCVGIADLSAYTYTYYNRTGYGIRLKVELYNDGDNTIHIKANDSQAITTKSLLKSWIAEVFTDDKWNQILNLTCDFLPGDHTFSIYVKEKKSNNGALSQDWNVITDLISSDP